MAQAAVESAVSGGALIGRPAEVPRMKRKTPSELRVMPLLHFVLCLSNPCLFSCHCSLMLHWVERNVQFGCYRQVVPRMQMKF
jgi:hypothetical protein